MHAQEYIDLVKSTLDALDPKSLDQLVDAFHTTYSKGGNIYTMGMVDLGLPHLMPQGIS